MLGLNGAGKTNLLDAIYYLSFSKSAVGSPDHLLISLGQPSFTLFGTYEEIVIAIQSVRGKTKTIKINGQQPEKSSDLIGKVPLVMVLPDDTQIIKEGSDSRRKFFDGALCQFDKEYLDSLLKYNKVLKQRNSLLKLSESQPMNFELLETYDELLVPLAQYISKKRRSICELFLPYLVKNYQDMHQGNESPGLAYQTHVSDSFKQQLKSSLQKDQLMRRTLLGSHRDEILFTLDDEPIKKFGSQGQQKTFIIALKLALYDFLKDRTGKTPLLLLDDIFDKLDDERIRSMIALLDNEERFEQIFISDARADRSNELLKDHQRVNTIEL